MLGKLVVHIKEYSSADVEDVANKVIRIIRDSESKYFVNHFEVKRIRLSPSARGTYESGQSLRVKNSADQASAYTYGTLGCFVKAKNNLDSSEQLFGLTCAHVFPDGCHPVVKISRAHPPSNWETIGNFIPEFKLLRELHVDIAAIALTVAEEKLNHCLKNSHGCDKWKSTLHDGDVKDILGFQVYKWGPVSNCTRGLISSVSYLSRDFNSQLNVFIKKQTESQEKFSSEGDSGSAVCFDSPTDETVQVVSLLNGEMTVTTTESQEFSYSVHLEKNLGKLSEQSNHSFELYNLDQ